MKVLSKNQVKQFETDGFIFPVTIMSEDDASAFREKLERTQADGKLTGSGQTKFYLRFPWVHDLATSDAVLDPVEDLLGPNLMLYHNTMWCKDGGDGSYVSWHQDNTYFGHTPCKVVTVWIALSTVTIESGCMQFLPGTHKLGELPLGSPDIENGNLLSSGQTVDYDVSNSKKVPVQLKPGQASIHHAFLVHSSEQNNSKERRLGMTLIYHPTHLKQSGKVKTSALLVRGKDLFRNFYHEKAPEHNDSQNTMDRYHKAVALYRAKVREMGNQTIERFDRANKTNNYTLE